MIVRTAVVSRKKCLGHPWYQGSRQDLHYTTAEGQLARRLPKPSTWYPLSPQVPKSHSFSLLIILIPEVSTPLSLPAKTKDLKRELVITSEEKSK